MKCAWAINFFKYLLSITLLAIFIVPFILIFLIFFVYRTSILIILKLQFGSKFGRLMTGTEAFFAADTSSGSTINVLMIVRSKQCFPEYFRTFKETVNTKLFKNPQIDPKFLSTRHKLHGYHYFIRNGVEIDECVRTLNFNCNTEQISKEDLLKEISKYSKQPLPCNNTGFWEFLLCETPITWNNKMDKTQKSYAVLLRFHHSLTDGVTLINLMLNIFSKSSGEKKAESLYTLSNILHSLDVKMRKILSFFYVLLITPIVLLSQMFLRHVEISSIHASVLSDEQILVAKIEESSECLKIIKEIKRKVQDTSFIDVLAVAVSKSFSNYFQKKGKDPNLSSLNIFISILMNKPKDLKLTEANPVQLTNNFSWDSFNIPIKYNTTAPFSYWESFVETLEKIKIETKYVKSSSAYKVIYGMFEVAEYFFPESIALRLVNPPYVPLIVTNIPGPSVITLFDDCIAEDIVFWVPRIKRGGFTLGILSYDDRLQISLNADKVIISNEQNAQDIVDGIYQALIQMDNI